MMNSQISPQEAANKLIERRRARGSLLGFTQYTKPDYEANWHHRLLCDYLDKFVSGEIKRLMVFMPPRHGKSELVSRRLPAYIFGKRPNSSVIACSYSADLASLMNRDVQRIIDDTKYKALFPDTTLSGDNARKTEKGAYLRNSDIFEIVGHRGAYRSSGVGGGITGMGCDVGIIDDPIKNREEAASTTYREKIWEWYTSTFYTRLEKDAQILVTLTRWHEDDLGGRLLKQSQDEAADKWTILNLPAICEENQHPKDPRAIGDPLWENKYDLDRLAKIRVTIGQYDWASLYQQRPAPKEGGLWKYADIHQYRYLGNPEDVPGLQRVVVGVDPAVTGTSTSDETGIVVAGVGSNNHYYVLGDYSVRGSPLEWARKVVFAFEEHRADRVVGETNNGGDLVEVNLRTIKRDIPYKKVTASRGKQMRAEPIAALYEQGLVHHIGHFPKLEDQMCSWLPGMSSPDRVDALVWAITELSEKQYDVGDMSIYTGFGGIREEEDLW
ncbi:MAG: terminase family protein [Candidatus Marinimicrobia bacterium]|nr:terminase family protein [Candidatus Neomarinimicrobiota bacterium]